MGVYEWLSDPANQGALAGLAQGFGQAAMPSRTPIPLGAALGMAAGSMMQGKQQAINTEIAKQQAKMLQAQAFWQQARAAPLMGGAGQGGQGAGADDLSGDTEGQSEGAAGPFAPGGQMSLTGDPSVDTMIYGANPGKYTEALIARRAPALTDTQKNLLASGIRPGTPQWTQAMQAQTRKDSYIPGEAIAPGGSRYDPATGNWRFAPDPSSGTVVVPDPSSPGGFAAAPVAGAAQARAGMEGAISRARSGGEYKTFETPTGQQQVMTQSEAAGDAPASGGGFGTPSAILDAIEHVESSGGQNLFGRDSTGKVKAIGPYQFTPDTLASAYGAGVRFNPMDRTDARRGADWLMQQNLRATGGDMRKALSMYNTGDPNSPAGLAYADKALSTAQQGGGRPTFGMSAEQQAALKGDEAALTESGKNAANVETEINQQADAALGVKRSLAEMRNLAQGFDPSSLAGAKMHAGAFFQALGVPADDVTKYLGNVGDMQAFQKQTAALAAEAIKQISPRATQMEFQRFLENNPNIFMTQDGLKRVLDYMDRAADSSLDRQQSFAQFKTENPNPRSWGNFNAYWNNHERQRIAAGAQTSVPPSVQAPVTAGDNPARVPSAAAIGHLKMNPSLRDKFDEWYGAGSAEKVLGK